VKSAPSALAAAKPRVSSAGNDTRWLQFSNVNGGMSVAEGPLGGINMHSDKNVNKPVNEALKNAGYDAEEEFFFHLNKELIERNRRRLDEHRRQMESQERVKSHWMMCPKCGSQLKESVQYGVKAMSVDCVLDFF
jgi:hypothetical protein